MQALHAWLIKCGDERVPHVHPAKLHPVPGALRRPMPELIVEQAHTLGLPKARQVAQDWIAQAQADWGMAFECRPGLLEDEILFSRSGAKGSLLVRADSFELRAQLGFFLGSFQAQIEAHIRSNLQALLDQHSGQA